MNSTTKNNHPKSVKITQISSVSSQKKPKSSHFYNTFFTNEGSKKSKYHNKFLNDFPFRIIGVKSNSTDKAKKTKSKFGQYKNYSKHYCITLNQYAQYKQNYLSLNSQSNSKNKSNSKKSNSSRPSTAQQKNKSNKKQFNSRADEHKNKFAGFNGIVNIRTNLINNKNNRLNNNKKMKIKENKNNEFITLFNPTNTFTNNILMNITNGVNNNYMANIRNGQGNNKTLFEDNNRRIGSLRIFLNQNGYNNKKQNNGKRIRLNSAVVNNTIPFMNNNNQKKHRLK